MRKLKKKFLRIGGRKVICLLAVVGTVVLLSSMAMAVMTEQEITPENCPNHAEHDESCGYVEAVEGRPCSHEHTEECYVDGELNCQHVHDESCGYVEAVEGHPCEHKCPVCDSADKIEEKIDGKERVYDLNKNAEEHQDVQIQLIPHSDVLNGIALVTDEWTADGQPVLQELKEDTDYIVENIDEENSVVKLRVEYLDAQKEGMLRFQLQFEGGEQEVQIRVIDTEEQEQEKTDSGIQEADETETRQNDEVSTPEKASENSRYEISGEASTIPNDTEYVNVQKIQRGTLSLKVALPIGEKGRWIKIDSPLYGAQLLFRPASVLPPADGKILGSGYMPSAGGRISVYVEIADNVDETLNFQLKYGKIDFKNSDVYTMLDDGELPKTGFHVSVLNEDDTILGESDIGTWRAEFIEGEGMVAGGGSFSPIRYDGKNSQGSIRINFPKNVYEGEEAFAEIKEVKIFVPDPEIIHINPVYGFSRRGITSGSSNTIIPLSCSEIQSDGEHWWYIVTVGTPEYRATNYFPQQDGAGYEISIDQSYAGGAEPVDPSILDVPAAEITIKKYGSIEKIEQKIKYTMGDYIEKDTFQIVKKFINGPGGIDAPYNPFADSVNNKTSKFVSIVNGNGSDGNKVIFGTHKADPTTESYEFPYEIQPTIWYAQIEGDTEIEELRYETSDGISHLANIVIEGGNLSAQFDEIPDGERVIKVDVTWKRIWRENIRFEYSEIPEVCIVTDFSYQVPKYYEDGSSLQPNKLVQVKHKVSSPKFGTLENKFNQLNFQIHGYSLPNLSCDFYDSGNIIPKGKKWISAEGLSVQGYYDSVTTVENPIIRLFVSKGVMSSEITGEELAGYVLTGRFTVMPFLAGWDIQYRTEKCGTQTYHIPDDIPETGLELTLITEEGDRLYGNIAFSKQGVVNGWNNGVQLIKNVEFMDLRMTEDGRSPFLSGVYKYTLNTYFTCNRDYDSSTFFKKVGKTAYATQFVRQEYALIPVSIKANTLGASSPDLFQGGSGNYVVNMGNLNWGWSNSRVANEVWGRSDVVPFGEKITMYIEMKNSEVLYMGGDFSLKLQNKILSNCEISYFETANGKMWLKIESLAAVESLVSSLSGTLSGVVASIEMYALPGAQLGIKPSIGDIYLDINAASLISKYDGSPENNYIKYQIDGLVPDLEGLLEDGDTTSPRLYKYSAEKSHQILQKIFSGVSIIPGKGGIYEITTRKAIVYNHEMEDTKALISIGSSNEELKDYEVVVEIPKKGKQAVGLYENSNVEVIKTSEFTMDLKAPVSIVSNPMGVSMEFKYRLIGSTKWIAENEITNWAQVDAVKVSVLDTLPQYAALNLELNMRSDQKIKEDDEFSYISGTFSYVSQSSLPVNGSCVLGEYISRIYTLKGTVWDDKDEDGNMASSEAKATGITVNIKRLGDDTIVDTQKTDVNGNFKFLLYEGKNLYLEVETADGYKLTRKTSNIDFIASGMDSDFNRETNRLELPDVLVNGSYENISAGIVRLPILSAPDMIVAEGKQIAGSAVAESDRGGLILNYENSADKSIAVVKEGAASGNSTNIGSAGWITGNSLGETTAKVWVENSLGDRVESTYKITVVPDIVDFTLGKNLTSASREDETFVFMIEHQDESGQTDEIFYQTVKIPAGSQSGSIEIKKVKPGSYRITELDSNWRYSAQGGNVKNITMDDSEETYRVDFTNTKDTDAWISGKTEVTNTMQDTAP